jgi:DNA-binding transcriptional ArsR family regulator
MSDLEFIAPVKTATVSFSLDPVQNAISDLVMLTTTDTSGFADWITDTARDMPEEFMATSRQVMEFIGYFVDKRKWSSFPEWLEYISSRDPNELRDEALNTLLSHALKDTEGEAIELPSADQLLADRDAFNNLMEHIYKAKGKPFVEGCCDPEYSFFQDPSANQKLVVDHLRALWEQYLEPEWQRNIPLLQECNAAFETIDFRGKSLDEIILLVADREVPEKWGRLLEDVEEIIFVPSPHIGPYLIGASVDETMQVVFGARIPKGAGVTSPALTRSDLLNRISALADDTRLRILHLLAQEGEQSSQTIMARLELSQSAASRHLRQLAATGYLIEQRVEGAKVYRLNSNRIEGAFTALEEFLG